MAPPSPLYSCVVSVPSAVFSYLYVASSQQLEGGENSFQKTLEFAMRFGGDSDTIMSMAGAIAGAKYGLSGIPQPLIHISEGTKEAVRQAESLVQLISSFD